MSLPMCERLKLWGSQFAPVMHKLGKLAGASEEQFLALGKRLQDFSDRSSRISSTASELVELVAGSESSQLTGRLATLLSSIEQYLDQIKSQGSDHFSTLEQIMLQLDNVVQPLEGFQKMDKALKMLSISTKIESSRLGDLGSGFITLAMDVEKLSSTVNEKSAGIMGQRLKLSQLIGSNIEMVRKTEEGQYASASTILSAIKSRIELLEQLNEACSSAGCQVQRVSEEVSEDIGNVVSSMQFHDISRQQIEHIIEALQKLEQHTCKFNGNNHDACPQIIAETGDVCELQSAQLRHAESQLYNATVSILDCLKDIALKQAGVTLELQQTMLGNSGSSESSPLDLVQQDMRRITEILHTCTLADQKLTEAMTGVTNTIAEICNFVKDIESVGSEIDLIALNAQIKAAHTGTAGAALGVLAEAIKRLSLDAVTQTESVSGTLEAINRLTAEMENRNAQNVTIELSDVSVMEKECKETIESLGRTNRTVIAQLSSLASTAESLADDISTTTSSVSVHETSKQLSEDILSTLEQIISEARDLEPASTTFRDNLRNMEKRYTMESERMIHEMMASRHGVKLSLQKKQETSANDSVYGDNVDLF